MRDCSVDLIDFFSGAHLSSILVIANADGALSTSTVGPVTSNLGSSVAVLSRSSDDPEAENSLGEDVEDGVDDDLGTDLDLPSATSGTPDNKVDEPEDERSDGDGAKEASDLSAAGTRGSGAGDSDVPDGEDKGDDADSIPSPFLGSVGMSNSGESTRENKDHISNDGKDGMRTINTREETKLDDKQRCRERPVNISSPEDLATDFMVGVRNMLVVIPHAGAVEVRCLTRRHGEVGEGRDDGGESCEEVKDATLHGNVP